MLVGRQSDCARIDDLLEHARRGSSGSLVLRGEAGIGKTALLEYAVARAEGMTVVRALGVESEAELPFSGLVELLRPLLHLLPEIPGQQAHALRSALGLGEPEAVDRLTIGAAALNLLSAAAEESPLLLVVDDAHWLDGATLDALRFAARRLVAEAVAILLAVREDAAGRPPLGLPGSGSLVVRGLDSDDAARLLAAEDGAAPAPPVAALLWEATGGNPLALLETRRELTAGQLAGDEPLPEPLPAGAALEDAFARSAGALPPDARTAVVVVAAAVARENDPETIGAALESLGIGLSALEAAEDAGLVTIGGGRIAFRHPLIRSAVFHAAAPSERRAAHRALAEVVRERADPAPRAWHLAGAAAGPDEEAASALEAAARDAAGRSGYAAAAAALARAAALSAGSEARVRRLHAAADAAFRAGRAGEAAALLAEPLTAGREPRLRAEALRLHGRIEYLAGRPREASAALLQAASLLEGVDPGLAVERCAEACTTLQIVGDAESLLAAADRASALAAAADDEDAARLARFTRGWALCVSGRPREGLPLVAAEAAPAAAEAADADPLEELRTSIALDWLDGSDEALRRASRVVDRTRAQGAAGLLPHVLLQQAWQATRAGRLGEAHAAASEALALTRELDLLLPRLQALLVLAALAARRGAEDECRRRAGEVLPPAEEGRLHVFRVWARYSLGVLALGLGRLDEARRELELAAGILAERGLHSPSLVPRAELVEVHARRGDVEAAAAAFVFFSASPEADSPLGLATAARGAGLLETGDFEMQFEEAFHAHERSADRWALARTRLCHGERLRRAGRRADAREQLRRALAAFEELGAGPWAERARSELRASGERIRRRPSHEWELLTPQELQLALHAARGMTNREVGAALFLSHKTVEFHLARIYRKLGLHSRAELVRRFAVLSDATEEAPS